MIVGVGASSPETETACCRGFCSRCSLAVAGGRCGLRITFIANYLWSNAKSSKGKAHPDVPRAKSEVSYAVTAAA